ncbi:lysophospholipid acyltransferase LPCAT4 [Morone saxatilis]|uniref:lysophospholipid acyltransferase LPCAT4 n=1 Tax=Morone saxatilis TaxID=34816 RepID=UPI0015E24CF6|nr:lysophospholipid acyltransferase LPCAT4 [Morone saxatilis]
MEKHDCHLATHEYPHPFIHTVKLTRAQRIRGVILGTLVFPLSGVILGHPPLSLICSAVMRGGLSCFSSQSASLARLVGWPASGRETRHRPKLAWSSDLRSDPWDRLVSRSNEKEHSLPVIGALLEFNQSVIVSRKDPESRKKAVAQLTERLTSGGYWPQMLMFPEGTTTNGSALIKFKPGAFLAGVPVQPVLLRYPNKLDTVRWTYKGTTWVEALWHTTSQFYTNLTVEFLPVYKPSQEEKNDPNLYADNVQKLMAKALGIPATDYVMEGRVPVNKLGGLSLPLDSPARETLSLLHKDGLGVHEVEAALDRMIDRCQSGAQGTVQASAEELASLLRLTDKQTAVRICGLYSKDEIVDLRQIYLSVAALSGFASFKSLLHTAFTLFDKEGKGSLSAEELSDLMGALLGFPQHHTAELYTQASNQGQLTEERLLRVLTTHPTYQRVGNEYMQSEEAGSRLANGKAVNNNGNMHNSNGSFHYHKKLE